MPNIEALREHIPFRQTPEKESVPERIADTLVIYGNTIYDKKRPSYELDDASRYAAGAVSLILGAELARRAVLVASNDQDLTLLEGYLHKWGVNKKSLVKKLSKGIEHEAEELHELTKDPDLGSIAIISPGNIRNKTIMELKEKGINTDSLSLKPEEGKRIVEKTRLTDLGKLLSQQVMRFKSPININLNLLSQSHA